MIVHDTNPGNCACAAAVLLVIGLEVEESILKHVFNVLGGLVAIIRFFSSASLVKSYKVNNRSVRLFARRAAKASSSALRDPSILLGGPFGLITETW
jgi:hypothetical protein